MVAGLLAELEVLDLSGGSASPSADVGSARRQTMTLINVDHAGASSPTFAIAF